MIAIAMQQSVSSIGDFDRGRFDDQCVSLIGIVRHVRLCTCQTSYESADGGEGFDGQLLRCGVIVIVRVFII